MLFETRDDRNVARGIEHRLVRECGQSALAECDRARTEARQRFRVEKRYWITEYETRHADLYVLPHRASMPRRAQSRDGRDAFAHCANHSECKERPQRASWRSSRRAAPVFRGRSVPPEMVRFPPSCSRQVRTLDCARAFPMAL